MSEKGPSTQVLVGAFVLAIGGAILLMTATLTQYSAINRAYSVGGVVLGFGIVAVAFYLGGTKKEVI
jgi:hypothetical protein